MTEPNPSPSLWRELYQLADQVMVLKPWRSIEESNLFGVEDPVSHEIGFVSVTGMFGEHLAVMVHRGLAGLKAFRAMQKARPKSAAAVEAFFAMEHLQISFEDRDQLHEQDWRQLASLGLKYRGKQSWPMFRSHRPGYYPWFMDELEGHTMKHVLEQALGLFPSLMSNPALTSLPKDHYVIRVPSGTGNEMVWKEEVRHIPPEEKKVTVISRIPSLEALKGIPKGDQHFEMDVRFTTHAVRDGEEKPCFPHVLMVVDRASRFVLAAEFMLPKPSFEAMWAGVAEKICAGLVQHKTIPSKISLRSDLLEGVLAPVAQETGMEIHRTSRLPILDVIMRDFMKHMMSR